MDLALAEGLDKGHTGLFGEGLALLTSLAPTTASPAGLTLLKLIGICVALATGALPYRHDLTVLPMSQAEWTAAEMASDIVVNY